MAGATLGRSQDVCKGAPNSPRANGALLVVDHFDRSMRFIEKMKKKKKISLLGFWGGHHLAQRDRGSLRPVFGGGYGSVFRVQGLRVRVWG